MAKDRRGRASGRRARRLRAGPLAALAAGWAVVGCGWVEWPPAGSQAATTRPLAPAERRVRGGETVIVNPGEMVYDIARRRGVSVRALIQANGLVAPFRLEPGRRLIVPDRLTHEVRRGDTLYGISRQYGIDMFALARANGLAEPYVIRVGQRLDVPVGGAVSSSAPTRDARGGPAVPPSPAESEITRETLPPAPASSEAAAGPPETEVAARPVAPGAEGGGAEEPQAAAPARREEPRITLAPADPPGGSAPEASTGRGFAWPLRGEVVSAFGPTGRGLHNDGINIAASQGAPVRAAEGGIVAYAGNELRGFGNLLLIKHGGGWVTAYAHNGEILVRAGERVQRGQLVARVGQTGNVSTPQLHFELRRGTRAVDPTQYLRGT